MNPRIVTSKKTLFTCRILKITFKLFFLSSLIFASVPAFSEGSALQKKFIRGNITDKVKAVKDSSGIDTSILSTFAIKFSLENYETLGEDKDLSALATIGVISLPNAYITSLSTPEKQKISDEFHSLYVTFSSETLKIAILNKIILLQLENSSFVSLLNKYIESSEDTSSALTKTVISTLSVIGDKSTFLLLFSAYDSGNYLNYTPEIREALSTLSEKSQDDISLFIQKGTISQAKKLFDIAANNEKSSLPFRCNIAESVLSRAMFIMEKVGDDSKEAIDLEKVSYTFLATNHWTYSSKVALQYFSLARKLYETEKLSREDFSLVIKNLSLIAPLDCVSPLSTYLQAINKEKESPASSSVTTPVSDEVILSIISALGSIGDKNAFDALLSVTYYNYSDSVVKAAQDALARLKW